MSAYNPSVRFSYQYGIKHYKQLSHSSTSTRSQIGISQNVKFAIEQFKAQLHMISKSAHDYDKHRKTKQNQIKSQFLRELIQKNPEIKKYQQNDNANKITKQLNFMQPITKNQKDKKNVNLKNNRKIKNIRELKLNRRTDQAQFDNSIQSIHITSITESGFRPEFSNKNSYERIHQTQNRQSLDAYISGLRLTCCDNNQHQRKNQSVIQIVEKFQFVE